MKKLLSVLAAMVVALSIPSAVLADGNPGDPCSTAQTGNWQMLAYRTAGAIGGNYMDDVRGDANLVALRACHTYASGHSTGTFVLPANVQDPNDPGNHLIAQLGFGRVSDDSSIGFYYVLNTTGAATYIQTVPNTTDTIRFRIYRRSSGYVSFEIYDVTTSTFLWTYYPTTVWPSYWKMDWWGYELLDKNSAMGSQWLAQLGASMTKMGYSVDNGASELYRSGLTCNGTSSEWYIHKQYTWDNGWVDACNHSNTGTWAQVTNDGTYDVFSAFDNR